MRGRNGTRRASRTLTGAGIVFGLMALLAPSAGAITPEPVLTGPQYQYRGHSNGVYMSWGQGKNAGSTNWNAYAKPVAGGSRIRLNADGKHGDAGGFDPGSNVVIYQQWSRRGSDLWFYDLDTDARSRLPDAVNTKNWEWNPEISDAFVLFGRYVGRRGEDRIMLFDRDAGSVKLLDRVDIDRGRVHVGAVGERYATWTHCPRQATKCVAWIYDSQTGNTRKIPSVDGRAQYAAVVDETTGEVYFSRSGAEFCRSTRILHAPLSDLTNTSTLLSLPKGVDTEWEASLAPNPVTGTDLWFGRYRCRANDGDVYVLRDIASA